MKLKALLSLAVFAMAGFFVFASAQNANEKKSTVLESQKSEISIYSSNLIAVTYRSSAEKGRDKHVVRVYDAFGYMVFEKFQNKKENVRTKYDVSQFPDGKYTFGIYEKHKLVCSKVIAIKTSTQTEVYDTSLALKRK